MRDVREQLESDGAGREGQGGRGTGEGRQGGRRKEERQGGRGRDGKVAKNSGGLAACTTQCVCVCVSLVPNRCRWHTEESSMAIQPSQKLRSLMAVHEAAHSGSSHTRCGRCGLGL